MYMHILLLDYDYSVKCISQNWQFIKLEIYVHSVYVHPKKQSVKGLSKTINFQWKNKHNNTT